MNNLKPSSRKNIIILVLILFFALGAIGISLLIKFQKVTSQFKSTKSGYEKLVKESQDSRNNFNKIQSDLAKMEKDYKAISQDRDNLLTQIKGLLADKNRLLELERILDKAKLDIEDLKKEKQTLLDENISLQSKIKEFETVKRQLITEKEQLQETLETERAKSFVKKMEQEKANLQKENSDLTSKLKQLQSEFNQLKLSATKTKEELDKSAKALGEAKEDLGKFKDDYAEAVKKNKAFEQKVTETPKKFAEIARQNTVLIKQTSQMHYNLGVFYMNQKDYSRALAEFEKALELTPDDAYSHFNIGYIYAEYIVDRQKAIEHFRNYLRLAKKDDKDVDWVKKYILTWETWKGKQPIE